MKKWTLAMAIGLFFAFSFSSFGAFAEECEDIRRQVLRLHILANSDTEEDQALKAAVRDAVLANSSTLFASADDRETVLLSAAQSLESIRQIAEGVLREAGCDHKVEVILTRLPFTTRVYEEFTLPAGEYDAVQIRIGDAQGQNWWCVLYPPLCLPAATDRQALNKVWQGKQLDILTKPVKYRYRFALLDWWEQLRQKWN